MKNLIIVLLVSAGIAAESQNMQVQNMSNYLRTKEYAKAKTAADAAAEHESTKNSAKMWMLRGKIYRAIAADTVGNLDPAAAEKALEACINCLKLDKGKDIYKQDVSEDFGWSAAVSRNKAGIYRANKQFDLAAKIYDQLDEALTFDPIGNLKANNITRESLMYERFKLYRESGDLAKQKEAAEKLIAMNYKDDKLYTSMVKTSLDNKDTAAALNYIEKGKNLFPDNMYLITSELDIYIARKKTDVLLQKLQDAIAVSPNNEVLHVVLANVYKGTKDNVNAEKEYLKALEIKPDYEAANYNLGVMYYSQGKEWNEKLNALPMKDPKNKEYEARSNDYFKKAVTYFEKSYEVTKDPQTKKVLRQLTLRLGDTEKAEKYK